MLLNTLLFTSLVSYTYAHGQPSTPFANHPAEIARRQLEANKRHIMARNCAHQVAEYQRVRKARRELHRRGLAERAEALWGPPTPPHHDPPRHGPPPPPVSHHPPHPTSSPSSTVFSTHPHPGTSTSSSSTVSAHPPHYSTIQNLTCVMAPEIIEGPYYIHDEFIRQDLRESQPGTTLYLDIGVMDISTCKPASNVFVEFWSANAQGEYSGFGAGPPSNATTTSTIPTETVTGTPTGTFSVPPPTGTDFGTIVIPSPPKNNNLNWLRGGLPTNEHGMVELVTIFPGFYSGRTVHVHAMVHQNISYHSNGTIISASGGLRHTGQIFFDEAINTEVLAQAAYQGNPQQHTYNDEDLWVILANAGGYSAFADIEKLGDSLDDGLLGYLTIGIDPTASYNISSTNYYDPNFSSALAN